MRRTKASVRFCGCAIRRQLLVVLLFACGVFSVPLPGRTFLDALPTRGLYRPTAHNLARGESQIQFFAFTSPTNPLAFFEFEYGLTDSFQFGMRPMSALFGDVRVWSKVHVGTTGPVSLAIPFGAEVLIPVPLWSIYGGWVLSWRVLPLLTLHPGISLLFFQTMTMQPFAGLDLDVWRNVKLFLEVDSQAPYVHAGVVIWAFGFVRLQIDTPLPSISLRVSVSGRF